MKKIAANNNYRMLKKRASGIKVVYNTVYGGFGLSAAGVEKYNELAGSEDAWPDYISDVVRHDPVLVRVVEELGDRANGNYSDLQIFELPGNQYKIEEYDGNESVATPEAQRWIEVK